MKLSIIIINYKSRDILNRCLNCIQSDYSHEIIVIDNDNDLPEIERKDIQIIPYAGNLGFSGANNKAMDIASGEYILFLNADVFLTSDYIDHCIHYLDLNPKCSSAQGKLLKDANHELIDSTGNIVTKSLWAFNEHHLDHDHHITSHEIFGVCCAAGIFRRSALEDIKDGNEYFDEEFFAYLEDVDLNIRLRSRGYTSWFVESAIALHMRETSTSSTYRLKQSLINRFLLVIKHRTIISILGNSIIFLPLSLLMSNKPTDTLRKIMKSGKKRSGLSVHKTAYIPYQPNSKFLNHSMKRLKCLPLFLRHDDESSTP